MKLIILIILLPIVFACDYDGQWSSDFPYSCSEVSFINVECFLSEYPVIMNVTMIQGNIDENSTDSEPITSSVWTICECPCTYENSTKYHTFNYTVSLSGNAHITVYGYDNTFNQYFSDILMWSLLGFLIVSCGLSVIFHLIGQFLKRREILNNPKTEGDVTPDGNV